MIPQTEKQRLGLYGEYRVLAELLRNGYNATLTMGNAKATDIVVFSEKNKYLRIEVKTSKNLRNFVTGFFPKYTDPNKIHPDIWIFFIPGYINQKEDVFYILTHQQVREAQLIVNKGNQTQKGKGVDNISIKRLEENYKDSKNNWLLINLELEK